MDSSLWDEFRSSPTVDSDSRTAVRARIDDILRPAGAMAQLDEVAVWLAGWQRTSTPEVVRPVAVIFAGDHGVAAEGVSAYPAEVTGAMFAAFEASKASISAVATVAGASVTAVDVGIGKPSGNLRIESALTQERFAIAFDAGRASVAALHTDLLIVGEMGIGNTTAAAAVCAAIVGTGVHQFVGRGTGVDDAAFQTKADVVTDALDRIAGQTNPMEILREVGGTELVAMAGALFEARMQSIPVLLDGYIATSPALVLHAIDPELIANCWAGHCSAEPGHRLVLDHIERKPLLTLDMALGEATGAMAAVPLVKMACAMVTNVATFTEWFGASA